MYFLKDLKNNINKISLIIINNTSKEQLNICKKPTIIITIIVLNKSKLKVLDKRDLLLIAMNEKNKIVPKIDR